MLSIEEKERFSGTSKEYSSSKPIMLLKKRSSAAETLETIPALMIILFPTALMM
jgi:hypothetical protein